MEILNTEDLEDETEAEATTASGSKYTYYIARSGYKWYAYTKVSPWFMIERDDPFDAIEEASKTFESYEKF